MRYRVGLTQKGSKTFQQKRPSGLYFAGSKARPRATSKPVTGGKNKKASSFKQSLSKFLVILFGVGVFLSAIGLVVLSIYLKNLERSLPDPEKLVERDAKLSTQIFDRHGTLLYTFYGEENREFVKLEDIPSHTKWALLSAEDAEFYQHKGLDITAIVRAVFQKLTTGTYVSGGSTISQQLIRNTILKDSLGTQAYERTATRKLKEWLTTMQMEQKLSKDEILQLYMNEVFMGGVNYGFQSASKAYFGKDVRQLTLAESALLAGLIQTPSVYAPIGGTNPELAKERQKYVLNQMLRHSDFTGVTQEDVDKALAEKLVYKSVNVDIKAPHFVFYVKKELDELYGPDQVIHGGLKVKTTLDYSMQKLAEKEVKEGIASKGKRYNVNNGAMVAMDPKTGDILAMVGSINYYSKNPKIDGNVNITISPRQMGSSVKPYTYLTAFGQGYGPWLETPDIQLNFGNYKLKNWDGKYYGPMTARQGLIQSRNLPAVYTMQLIGVENFIKTAETFGITTLTEPSRYGLSLTLGAAEMKLLEHANAYATFATGGIKHGTRAILEVKNSAGEVILAKKDNPGKRIWDEKEIYMLNWILCDLGGFGDQPENRNYMLNGRRTFCGKTGTTDGPKDLTSFMYSKSLVVGVWAGNNDNTETPGAWSTTVPLPIAGSFMTKMAGKYKPEPFNRPTGIIAGTVCNDTGESAGKDSSCKKVPTIYVSGKSPKSDGRTKIYICKDSGKLSTNAEFAKNYGLVNDKIFLDKKLENTLQQTNYEKYLTKNNSYTFTKPEEAECKLPLDGDNPTVQISSPSNNETVYAGSTIDISAFANAGAPITKVEFLFDGSVIASDTSAPYASPYEIPSGTSAGSHNITAIVYSSDGKTSSSTIVVNVSNSTVSLTMISPSSGSEVISLPTNFSAASIGAGISKVEFILTGPGGYSKLLTDTNGGDGWSVAFNDSSAPHNNSDYQLIARALKGISMFYSNSVNFKINY
ncbi:transglycosylase domain-containing protein [bacterium]|nr:transglycosylase domain-containing protein [bacterium]